MSTNYWGSTATYLQEFLFLPKLYFLGTTLLGVNPRQFFPIYFSKSSLFLSQPPIIRNTFYWGPQQPYRLGLTWVVLNIVPPFVHFILTSIQTCTQELLLPLHLHSLGIPEAATTVPDQDPSSFYPWLLSGFPLGLSSALFDTNHMIISLDAAERPLRKDRQKS